MASINGVEVKNLKKFVGHEGECEQGNVYLNGKKLGFWSQDSWGGPDTFDFDESALDKACSDFKAGFPDSYKYKEFCDSKDVFIGYVTELKNIESYLKKDYKKGFKTTVLVTDGYHMTWMSFIKDLSEEELFEKYQSDIEKLKDKMFENATPRVKVFKPDSFDVVIDKEHPAEDFYLH